MKIGDEVFVHGFVDEIRVDQVIINNRGGYFGTLPDELRTIVQCKDCKHHGMTNCPVWEGHITDDYMWCYFGERREE